MSVHAAFLFVFLVVVLIYVERTGEGRHRQSDEHWNRFKGNVGETSERPEWSAFGFFRAHRYHNTLYPRLDPVKRIALILVIVRIKILN